MVCPYGGFPIICHNEVCDLTATLLILKYATEPSLQPISADTFPNATANTSDDAHLDVKAIGASGVGVRMHNYFDVRVFYPNASSYRSLSLASAYKRHGQRVREVEHGIFTLLVCTSTGGMGQEATVFYKRLADLLATHWGRPYSSTIHWLRCLLSFALLRSAILCIRGSRSSVHRLVKGPLDLSVVLVESRLTD